MYIFWKIKKSFVNNKVNWLIEYFIVRDLFAQLA